MNSIIQAESLPNDINIVSEGFDSFIYIQDLCRKHINCECIAIGNASDRIQFETIMHVEPRKNFGKNPSPKVATSIEAENQHLVDMINSTQISTRWILIKTDFPHSRSVHKKTHDLFQMVKCHISNVLPDYQPSSSWFALSFPYCEQTELSPEVMYKLSQLLVYWLNNFFSIDHDCNQHGVKLTPREHEVLRWIAEGKTSMDISGILGISAKTVNLHADNAINKFGAANRTNAVVRAMRMGII